MSIEANSFVRLRPLIDYMLQPDVDTTFFPDEALPDNATIREEVDKWIDHAFRIQDGGLRDTHPEIPFSPWPDRPDFRVLYGPVSLNTGVAGIIWNLLVRRKQNGHLASDEEDRLRRSVSLLKQSWNDRVSKPFDLDNAEYAYYGGLAGIVTVVGALAEAYPAYQGWAVLIAKEIIRAQHDDGSWTSLTAFNGDAGIVASLLYIAKLLDYKPALDSARLGADHILSQRIIDDKGYKRWPGSPLNLFVRNSPNRELDGFELGTIGIIHVMSEAGVVFDDSRYVQAAKDAIPYLLDSTIQNGDAAMRLSNGSHQISYGYCTGISGLIRAFVSLYHATKDTEWLEWAQRYGRGILRTGIPWRQPHFLDWNMHQCCGGAAILETFTGLWTETGDRFWRLAGQAEYEDLILKSHVDVNGRRWYSESQLLGVGQLKAEVGHQVGASGIQLALERFHFLADAIDSSNVWKTLRLPDDPYVTGMDR